MDGPLLSPLASLIAGLALFVLAVVAVAARRPIEVQRRIDGRARRVSRAYLTDAGAEAELEAAAEEAQQGSQLSRTGLRLLARIAEALGTLNLAGAKEQEKMRVALLGAGIRQDGAVRLLMAAKLLSMAVFLAVSLVAVFVGGVAAEYPIAQVGIGLGGALVGGMLPEILLGMQASDRRKQIEQMLPDALDLLIICANAGYSLDQAINRVGREIGRSAPALADELSATGHELRVMSDRRQALENLAFRTQIPSVRVLVSTMIQAQKYGTPLTQAFRTLATELRNMRVTAIEERAARLPGMISVPLMILILPALFLVVAGPAFIQVGKAWPQ